MPTAHAPSLLQELRKIALQGDAGDLSDVQLLDCFLKHNEEAAFRALVHRHGPMVMGVCRRMLGNEHDAEDAFQAVFLVLARSADRIEPRERVVSWLYGVAYRTARKAQRGRYRRGNLLKRFQEWAMTAPHKNTLSSQPSPPEQAHLRELQFVLDEELANLPEKYRTPIVLCDLEGKTRSQAARALGCPEGTLSGHLARGREMLGRRLTRRGVTLGTSIAAGSLAPSALPAAISTDLTTKAAQAAALLAAGKSITGIASITAISLSQGALTTMFFSKSSVAAALVVSTALLGTGVATMQIVGVQQVEAEGQESKKPEKSQEPAIEAKPGVDLYGDPLPRGAVARLGTMRWRAGTWDSGNTLLTPDGRLIIRWSREVFILDSYSGLPVQTLAIKDLTCRHVSVSSDSKNLVVCGLIRDGLQIKSWDYGIQLWSIDRGEMIHFIKLGKFERQGISRIKLIPDGQSVVILWDHGKISVRNLGTEEAVANLQLPPSAWNTLEVSPDGSIIVAGDDREGIWLWDWQSSEPPLNLDSDFDNVTEARFSPDGKHLVIEPGQNDGLYLFDTKSRKLVRKFPETNIAYNCVGPIFSPDGAMLAAAINRDAYRAQKTIREVYVWNTLKGTLLRKFDMDPEGTRLLSFTMNGNIRAIGHDGVNRLLNLQTGEKHVQLPDGMDVIPVGHLGGIHHIAYSPNGIEIATSDYRGQVAIWNSRTGKRRFHFNHNFRMVKAVAFSPNGKLFASSSLDDTIRVWDFRTGKQRFQLPGHGGFGGRRELLFSSDSKRLFSWGDDLYLRVWDMDTGKALSEILAKPASIELKEGQDGIDLMSRPTAMMLMHSGGFSDKGDRFFVALMDGVHVIDTASGKNVGLLDDSPGISIQGSAVSSDGTLFLASKQGRVHRKPLPNGDEEQEFENDLILIWDVDKSRIVARVEIPPKCAGPLAIAPDGKSFAAGTNYVQKTIYRWQLQFENGEATVSELPPITGLPAIPASLKYSPDGKYLTVGLQDTTGLVFDLAQFAE